MDFFPDSTHSCKWSCAEMALSGGEKHRRWFKPLSCLLALVCLTPLRGLWRFYLSPWKWDYMVVRLLIVLDWDIFHIYFLLMLPIIHYGYNLQVMGSNLETYKTPTLSSGKYALYLGQHFLYFKFRSNRDMLDFSFPSGFNSLTPWEFWEAGWAFSKHLWIGILASGGRLCYHEEKTCTSETTSSILNPSEKKCRQHSMAKLPLHWRLLLSITKNGCAEYCSSQLLQTGGPRSLVCVLRCFGKHKAEPKMQSPGSGIYRVPMRTPLARQNTEDTRDHQSLIHNAWLSHTESQMCRWFSQIINQTWIKKGDGISTALLNVCRQCVSAQTVKNSFSYRHPLQWQITHTCLSYV